MNRLIQGAVIALMFLIGSLEAMRWHQGDQVLELQSRILKRIEQMASFSLSWHSGGFTVTVSYQQADGETPQQAEETFDAMVVHKLRQYPKDP